MDVDLCEPCSSKVRVYGSAAESLGDELRLPLLVAIVCPNCLGAICGGMDDPAVREVCDLPPTAGPPGAEPSNDGYEPGANLYL